MKKNQIINSIFLITIIFSLSGCGDSQSREVKKEFMGACQISGTKKACKCVFNKIKSEFSNEDIVRFNNLGERSILGLNVSPKDENELKNFLDFTYEASKSCIYK